MEFKKKIVKSHLPDLYKSSRLKFFPKGDLLISFPPKKTATKSLVSAIINPITFEWKIIYLKKNRTLKEGIANNLVDAKRKSRYAMKELGVKFRLANKKTKGDSNELI